MYLTLKYGHTTIPFTSTKPQEVIVKRNIRIVTTLPNSVVRKQIGKKAFDARVEVSYNAGLADYKAGYRLVALCEKQMQPTFVSMNASLIEPIGNGMGSGRRLVIETAWRSLAYNTKRGAILWREPEKDLSTHTKDLLSPILSGKADITILNRHSLDNYPTFSKEWEVLGSKLCSDIIGVEADYYSGPRGLSLPAAYQFLLYPTVGLGQVQPDLHDSIFCPLLNCVQLGMKIQGVNIKFEYPTSQRDAEENDIQTIQKRMRVMRLLYESMTSHKQHLEM